MTEPYRRSPDPANLLLSDLEHFGDALLRNEEMGEKRMSFFITLVTAVAGGLVALKTAQTPLPPELLQRIAIGASAALLVIGILTYLRMLQRNSVTDQFKDTLRDIRGRYAALAEIPGYHPPATATRKLPTGLRAGYAETTAVANGGLTAALMIFSGAPDARAVGLGTAVALALFVIAARWRA